MHSFCSHYYTKINFSTSLTDFLDSNLKKKKKDEIQRKVRQGSLIIYNILQPSITFHLITSYSNLLLYQNVAATLRFFYNEVILTQKSVYSTDIFLVSVMNILKSLQFHLKKFLLAISRCFWPKKTCKW